MFTSLSDKFQQNSCSLFSQRLTWKRRRCLWHRASLPLVEDLFVSQRDVRSHGMLDKSSSVILPMILWLFKMLRLPRNRLFILAVELTSAVIIIIMPKTMMFWIFLLHLPLKLAIARQQVINNSCDAVFFFSINWITIFFNTFLFLQIPLSTVKSGLYRDQFLT